MAKTDRVDVRVVQDGGEITINNAGESHTYRITNGVARVEEQYLAHFLSHVEGSTYAERRESTGTSKSDASNIAKDGDSSGSTTRNRTT